MRPPRFLATAGLAGALVLAALAAGAVPATASPPPPPVLTLGSTTSPANPGDSVGSQLAVGTTLQLTTSPAPGAPGLTCTQSSWQGQVLNDPVTPGPASIRFVAPFKFTGCTDNNPTVTGWNGGGMSGLPAPLLITSAAPAYPIQILPFNSPLQFVLSLTTLSGPVTCVYQTSSVINGGTTAGTNPWTFTNQPFFLVSGPPPPCGLTGVGFLTASYGPVYDATAAANLTVN
jgi:hypothetical protein